MQNYHSARQVLRANSAIYSPLVEVDVLGSRSEPSSSGFARRLLGGSLSDLLSGLSGLCGSSLCGSSGLPELEQSGGLHGG